jgi:hypothetical protein
MKRFPLFLIAFSAALATATLLPVRSATTPVSVEADVRVSTDIDMAHTESDVAINPRNARDVVGATTVFAGYDGELYNKFYTSRDGGYTWTDTTPRVAKTMTGDPRVVFTTRGTAIVVSLDLGSLKSVAFRSTDGGETWSGPATFALIDHELVAVDASDGRYRNRIYIAAEGGTPDKHAPPAIGSDRFVDVFTSDNDGRSFSLHSRPITGVVPGSPFDRGGVGVTGLDVLRDGTVVLSFARYMPGLDYQAQYVATSHDGGRHFGPEHLVGNVHIPGRTILQVRSEQEHAGDVSGEGNLFALAADDSGAGYSGRLYAFWPSAPYAHGPLLFSYSADEGKTWSAPHPVGPADSANFQPEVAVNKAGVVAVTWFGTAGFPNRKRFNEYVALSSDGGRTFSSPARVSSAPSFPRTATNLRPVPLYAPEIGYGFISAYSRWGAGGDYVGLAASPDGTFLAYWPDSRGAEYQIYAARIHAGAPAQPSATATVRDVTSEIKLLIDPLSLDTATGEIDIPIRLQNTSRHVIFGPISVTFLGLQSAVMQHNMGMTAPAASILNAGNSESGAGAAFDYSHTLGSYDALPPGGVSEPIVWRFRVSDVEDLAPISLHVRVTARR